MDLSYIFDIVQTLSVCLAMVVSVSTLRARRAGDIAQLTEMCTDIKYIKEALNDLNEVKDRLTKVEEQTKHLKEEFDIYITQNNKHNHTEV